MKALLILILSLSFTFSALGQDYPKNGFTNKAEAKIDSTDYYVSDGKWITYLESDGEFAGADTNAPYYCLHIFKDGKPYGIEREYYKSGKIRSIVTYTNGNKNGIEKGYYENGKLRYERIWNADKLMGTKQFDETGKEIKK